MKKLAEVLGQQADRLVIDNTGLEGEYDFSLAWTDLADVDSVDPSLFTAIQEQLGLKLEPAKRPVQVTVIDSIQRPSEN
jgi:bla regulator protein BlaR1